MVKKVVTHHHSRQMPVWKDQKMWRQKRRRESLTRNRDIK
jgi:hypothetical protein